MFRFYDLVCLIVTSDDSTMIGFWGSLDSYAVD